MKIGVDADPHLAGVGLIGRNETGRAPAVIDRENVEAMRRPVSAASRSYAAPVERPAPPETPTQPSAHDDGAAGRR
jgi:hypothetical protein